MQYIPNSSGSLHIISYFWAFCSNGKPPSELCTLSNIKKLIDRRQEDIFTLVYIYLVAGFLRCRTKASFITSLHAVFFPKVIMPLLCDDWRFSELKNEISMREFWHRVTGNKKSEVYGESLFTIFASFA